MLPFFLGRRSEKAASEATKCINSSILTWSMVAAPTTATILPAVARASRMGAGRAAALVEALLRRTS